LLMGERFADDVSWSRLFFFFFFFFSVPVGGKKKKKKKKKKGRQPLPPRGRVSEMIDWQTCLIVDVYIGRRDDLNGIVCGGKGVVQAGDVE
jgi:hypothetical protein